jgi:hypothetical protein
MRLNVLEARSDWLATVEYEGSRGRQTLCLMRDRFTPGGYFWFIPDYWGEWPWDAVRKSDAVAIARMVATGKFRLVKGHWPRGLPLQREGMPAAPISCPSSSFAVGAQDAA